MADERNWAWPQGKRWALSLSFDDARPSQLDQGLPILDAHGAKATFYVSPPALEKRAADWSKAAAAGHELGNHTLTHPCSGNFSFSRNNALEDYSLDRMEQELLRANDRIAQLTGVTPRTFAYPCGQKFVGRGAQVQSYVPLIAKHFVCGRGFKNEFHNSPQRCDLAQVFGMDFDALEFGDLAVAIERTANEGGWLVLAGHDVNKEGHQSVRPWTLDALCNHAARPENGVWLATVADVAMHVRAGATTPAVTAIR